MTSGTEIANLLYLYAERRYAGDLDGGGDLFRRAEIKVAGQERPVTHE